MDRRSFVRTCVLAGSAGALAAGGFGLARSVVEPRALRPTSTRYFGAHAVSGPAPRGVPYVPITVRDGVFVAKTELDLFGRRIDVLDWHRFCGRRDARGLDPDFVSDNRLTFAGRAEYEHWIRPWFKPLIGRPIRPEDFPDAGFGADFVWRSEGVAEGKALPGVIMKVDPSTIRHTETPRSPGKALHERELDFVRREIFWNDFIAVSAVCTHFCCVAGYKTAEKLARPMGAWENVYCTCHAANFDARTPVAYSYERTEWASYPPAAPPAQP